MRALFPLLPVPVLVAVLAFSACSGSRSDEPAVQIVPPPTAVPREVPAPVPAAPATPAEVPPTEEEIRAFERPVPK